MASKYKDEQGRFLTKGLFYEMIGPEKRKKFNPQFTLKEDDYKTYKSMRRLYLEYEDPTEYSFAIEVLGSWDHWKKLTDAYWFKPHLKEWREELELKMRSKGIKQMARLATVEGNKDAAKWLAQAGFNVVQDEKGNVPKGKRGRPSKEEVEGELKKQARLRDDIAEDAARLGLTVLDGK